MNGTRIVALLMMCGLALVMGCAWLNPHTTFKFPGGMFDDTKDNDVAIADEKISSEHLVIENLQGTIWIEDLGSLNGTFIDGTQRLSSRQTLSDGTIIRLGSTVMVFRGEL